MRLASILQCVAPFLMILCGANCLSLARKQQFKSGESGQPAPQVQHNVQQRVTQSPKGGARLSITGRAITNCRSFSLDSPKKFSFVDSFATVQSMPTMPIPEVAFAGRSNVGKSSLLNAISGQHKALAVTSKTPGRTQLINLFKCSDPQGDFCVFADLPGYGFAKIGKNRKEEISRLMSNYFADRSGLKLVVLLVDSRREPLDSDLEMAEHLSNEGIPYIVVATKVDLLSSSERMQSLSRIQAAFGLPDQMPLAFSSAQGIGHRDVWRLIRDGLLESGIFAPGDTSSNDSFD